MTVPVEDAVSALEKMFEGTKPTVFKTGSSTRPYYMKVSQTNGLHISVLSNRIAAAMAKHVPNKLKAQPQIALALELFSEFQFGGTVPAQFMMLFTALEVMETKATKKRGPTIKRVKDALTKVGRTDAKAVGKQLDALYIARNDLIHEARAVTDAQLAQLKTIVRDTLKAMLD